MKKLVLIIFVSFFVVNLWAQERPLGTWQTFLPWSSAIQVTQSPDRIYCATPYSVFYVEKSDGSTGTLTKSTGLSDAGVSHISYNTGMNTLVITYTNSNIDLLVNGTDIYNVPDIKNAIISGSKNINDIAMIGDYAYLATDLGISVLDLSQKQIMSNYIIGKTGLSIRVNSIASDGISIFAATDEGVKSASLSAPNLQNYAVWNLYDTLGLPAGVKASLVGQINGRFYAVVLDTLFLDSNSRFVKVNYDTLWHYRSFSSTGGYLYACQSTPSYHSGQLLQIQSNGTITAINLPHSVVPYQITTDGATNWIADNGAGLSKYSGFTFLNQVIPDGPPDDGAFRMAVSNRTLYVAAGGTVGGEYDQGIGDESGPIIYNHDNWQSFPINYYGQISNCYDLVDVAVDSARKKAYYASLAGGLIEVDLTNNNITKYDPTNTNGALQYDYGTVTQIMSLALDPAGNLWMTNKDATNILVLKTVDGQWFSFHLNTSLSPVRIRKMMVDVNGNIWMGNRYGGMIVYNPGQNITDPADDQILTLGTGTGYGYLPSGSVWSIVSDNEGNVWVGTDVGIGTYYCAGSMFSTPGQVGCDATWIKVDQGGYIGYLFSTEIVQALAVDGADRKWVGSTNGVWLISADGTQQLQHFTSDNSPLPNNSIEDITIDQQTGEVWIGTDGGLVSYQGDAILGKATKGTALVYPNPVRSDYTGPIAIKGLVENAYVKITDASGILVYQGQANGGQMIWNGMGYSGNKVSTGIYMVYADASDGSQHNVAKIIFIK